MIKRQQEIEQEQKRIIELEEQKITEEYSRNLIQYDDRCTTNMLLIACGSIFIIVILVFIFVIG